MEAINVVDNCIPHLETGWIPMHNMDTLDSNDPSPTQTRLRPSQILEEVEGVPCQSL